MTELLFLFKVDGDFWHPGPHLGIHFVSESSFLTFFKKVLFPFTSLIGKGYDIKKKSTPEVY